MNDINTPAQLARKAASAHAIFAAEMWPVFNFGNPNERYQKFLANGRPAFQRLIDNVLLYESICVPTQDFLALTVLVGVLGENAVLELLDHQAIRFLRVKGALAYMGNGGGIQAYQISSATGSPQPFFSHIEEAVEWALGGLTEKPRDPSLPRKVLETTTEINVSKLLDETRHETYTDILSSRDLRMAFSLRNKDMNHLAGIETRGVRIYGGPEVTWSGDEIDVVLALAATNLEFRLTQLARCSDCSTNSPVGHLIKAKAQRVLQKTEFVQSFCRLRALADIPNTAEGVLQKQIRIDSILKLRETRSGEKFRVWFHEACCKDSPDIAKEYIALLLEAPKVSTLPLRVIRFLTTTAIGLIPGIGALIGAGASAIDSFFLESWLRGSSPKFFIDDLRQIQSGSRSRKS